MPEKSKSYTQLSTQLTTIMDWFESDEVDLDSAIEKYDQATKIISQMEAYLKTAENKIKKITTDLS